MRGVERRREVYWRCSWDLRYSGGRWDGGWEGGYLVRGGIEMAIWSIDGGGTIADAVDAYLQAYRAFRGAGVETRRHRGHGRSRGGISLIGVVL